MDRKGREEEAEELTQHQHTGIEKSKLTTVRLPRWLHESVSREAKDEHVGFNTIVNRLLQKHVEWDRSAKSFGLITVPRDLLVSLIGAVSLSERPSIKEQLVQTMKEMNDFWSPSSGPQGWLEFLTLFSRYGGLGTLRITDSGKTVHLRHELGMEASRMLGEVLQSLAMRSKLESKVNLEENSLTLRIISKEKGRKDKDKRKPRSPGRYGKSDINLGS